MATPFHKIVIPTAHTSRLGIITKNYHPNKWHLIINLSHPSVHSVYEGIPKDLCYVTVDSEIQHIQWLGQNSLLAKMDIRSSTSPSCRLSLANNEQEPPHINWRLLAFGSDGSLSCQCPRGLLLWILQQAQVSLVLHYYDDILTVRPSEFPVCTHYFNASQDKLKLQLIPQLQLILRGNK